RAASRLDIPVETCSGPTYQRAKYPTAKAAAALLVFHRATLEVARVFPVLDRFALVVLLLAPRQPDLQLREAVLKVQRERHQGQSLLPGLPDEPVDLLP